MYMYIKCDKERECMVKESKTWNLPPFHHWYSTITHRRFRQRGNWCLQKTLLLAHLKVESTVCHNYESVHDLLVAELPGTWWLFQWVSSVWRHAITYTDSPYPHNNN